MFQKTAHKLRESFFSAYNACFSQLKKRKNKSKNKKQSTKNRKIVLTLKKTLDSVIDDFFFSNFTHTYFVQNKELWFQSKLSLRYIHETLIKAVEIPAASLIKTILHVSKITIRAIVFMYALKNNFIFQFSSETNVFFKLSYL